MPRRDNPILRGQQLEPWTLRREPFASVQEFEPRIVHVGLPAVERERLTAAYDRRQLALRQVGEVNLALRRICPGQPQILCPRQPMHVGNVPLLAAADLDTKRIDQYEV